jgi:hypothetical protein
VCLGYRRRSVVVLGFLAVLNDLTMLVYNAEQFYQRDHLTQTELFTEQDDRDDEGVWISKAWLTGQLWFRGMTGPFR